MGLIKEPIGVDFIIQSPPLTEMDKKEISDFIQIRKNERKLNLKRTVSKSSKKITV